MIKTNMVKLAAMLVLSACIVASPKLSAAAPSKFTPELMQPNVSVLKIGAGKSLIKNENEVQLLDVNQETLSKPLDLNQKVLDVHVLAKPTKVVILTEGAPGRIEKHVFNENGVRLSKSEYKIKAPERGKVKWMAPANGVNERFMVQESNQFSLYTSSGSLVAKYNAQPNNSIYEYVNVVDWDVSAYPYLAVKYMGQRTMADDYFINIVNLYSKTTTEVPGLEINRQLRIDPQGRLNVWNSYNYENITPANAAQPDPTQKQTFHSLYNISSGKALAHHQSLFQQVPGQASGGWDTQLAGDTVFVQDLGTGLWSLYPTDGPVAIAAQQTGLGKGAKFIGYEPEAKAAFFLVKTDGSAAPELKRIPIE
ncbi:hypothetical protein [Paenibacillus sp. USDA918EY]|uniref:hypothetical protein n=1 Tax=Paenibacillus sp. USDA918EY TaxID=2689575 RepID=UPI00135A409E|nr:hypothetical protein [Paenibacillus sp. USDA918EY]